MVVSAMLIGSLHAAFEHREEAFNGVGVDSAVNLGNILPTAVMGVAMTASEQATNNPIVRSLIGHHAGFAGNVRFQNRDDGSALHVVNHDRAGLSGSSVNQRKNFVLVGIAPTFALMFARESSTRGQMKSPSIAQRGEGGARGGSGESGLLPGTDSRRSVTQKML